MITQSTLKQFTATDQHHRHNCLFLTDGCHYVRENGGSEGAYWLFDAIASYQAQLAKHKDFNIRHMLAEYQFWCLKVNADKSAVLTCVPDLNMNPVVEQKIEYTDFDLDTILIYVCGYVAMLPTEY